jgi:LuxR family maltose regulon positive regulatory protein
VELARAYLTLGDAAGARTVLRQAEDILQLRPDLGILSTYLGYREIGERLHRSRHTVKSQAMSIYRKLGVSSRGVAMTRLRELGMLGW